MLNRSFSFKDEIDFSRFLLFIISFLYIFYGIIYYIISTPDPLNFPLRLFLSLLFLLFLLSSIISKKIQENIYEYTRFVSFAAIIHLIYISYIDGFSLNYIVSLFIVILFANLIFKSDKKMQIYNFSIIILIVFGIYFSSDVKIDSMGFLFSFIVVTYLASLINKKRYNIEKKFKAQSKEYETVLNNTKDAIFLIDVESGEFRYKKTNATHSQLTGLASEDITGKTPEEITGEKAGRKIIDNYQKCANNKKEINYEEVLELPGGKKMWDTKLSPVIIKGKVKQIIGISRDITDKKETESKLEYLTFHDSLTGLYNRGYFEEEMNRLDTKRQLPLSIIIGDINGLKIVNDAFGHQQGDQLLKKIATILKKCSRHEDILARWGGDEFVFLLPDIDNDQVKLIYQRIKKEIEKEKIKTIKLSISFGYATKTKKEKNIKTLFKKAEENMYKRKLIESKKVHKDIIDSLKKTLFEISRDNFDHSRRIKKLAIKLGKELELSKNKLTDLQLLAEVHDLGKVAISQEILEKDGDLTQEEINQLNKHPEIGYQIAKSSPQLHHIAEDILYHHENWDGTGYPHKLKGEDIPFLARIIRVVDKYDKIINNYSDCASKNQAIKEIKQKTGSEFDPQIAEKFVRII